MKNLLLSGRCLNHSTFSTLGFLNYKTLWVLEISKNEANAARRMVVKLDLSLHARKCFRYFLVPNLQSWGSFAVIVIFFTVASWYDIETVICKSWITFLTASVLLYFSKSRSLIFDLPCFLCGNIHTNWPN